MNRVRHGSGCLAQNSQSVCRNGRPITQALLCLSSAPDIDTARRLTEKILQSRTAACVSLLPGAESHYWWQGQIESAQEVVLLIKTSGAALEHLKAVLQEHHPYDTPELICTEIGSGLDNYLDWLKKETRHVAGSDQD